MLERELRRLGELLARRLAAELGLELSALAVDLHAPLVHVHGHADDGGLVRDRALAGLADPPGGVGRELEPAPPVELLDRAIQPDDAVLDQIEQAQPVALVALGDRDHEAEVRVDHPLLRCRVAALDALRERDLLRRGEQRVAAGAVHEQGQRVGGAGGRPSLVDDLLGGGRSEDLDLARVELGAKRGDLLLVEVVLDRERLDGGLVDLSTLLGFVEKRLKRCFKQGAQFGSTPYARRRGARAACALPRTRWNAGRSCGIPGGTALPSLLAASA